MRGASYDEGEASLYRLPGTVVAGHPLWHGHSSHTTAQPIKSRVEVAQLREVVRRVLTWLNGIQHGFTLAFRSSIICHRDRQGFGSLLGIQ